VAGGDRHRLRLEVAPCAEGEVLVGAADDFLSGEAGAQPLVWGARGSWRSIAVMPLWVSVLDAGVSMAAK
jgi:predicted AAA+ superfamily ATPase